MNLYEKVKSLCDERGISIRKLEIELGIGNGIIGRWKHSKPNAERIKSVADYFNVSVNSLLDDEEDVEYYIDPEVTAIAEELKNRPELKVLFDASRNMSKETIEALIKFIDSNK